jgi:serine protease Do
VASAEPGSTASVEILRDGSNRTVSVTLDEAASSRRADRDDRGTDDKTALGIAVAPLTPELANELGASKDVKGVVVQEVNPSGRAADAGIQQGDIIEEVNRKPVQGVDDLRAAVRQTTDKPLLLLIHRKGAGDVFVTVSPANS